MQIGFDAKRLLNNRSGLGNYSRTLIQDLLEYTEDITCHLFTPKIGIDSSTCNFIRANAKTRIITPTRLKSIWRTMMMAQDFPPEMDIYHGLSHELPMGIHRKSIKSVVTIHDLIYLRYPADFPWIDRTIYHAKVQYSCLNADRIVAISEHTKKDIIDLFGISEERISVIYQTIDNMYKQQFTLPELQGFRKSHGLPESFILYVGALSSRKNALTLLKAYNQIPRNLQIPLLMVGSGKKYAKICYNYVSKNQLEDHIFWMGEWEASTLPKLYANAKFVVYPSYYEGFGLPVLEALWQHRPVLTSNRSSLPEAGGTLATYLDPDDVNGWTEALIEHIQSMGSDSLTSQNHDLNVHLQQFDSKHIVDQWVSLYREVLEN